MAQSVSDLQERVKEMKKIFDDLLSNYHSLDPNIQTQLVKGINGAFGHARGFLHEYLRAQKTLGKSRVLTTQTYGDVTAGEADRLFAKTSECKSVTQPDHGSVNTQIRKAIAQLSGATGFSPRADDVRIIDVLIEGDENPWPMGGGSYGVKRSSFHSLKNAIDNAEKAIIALLNEPAGGSLLTWLAGQTLPTGGTLAMLKDVTYNSPAYGAGLSHPSSSRPIVLTPSSTPGSSDIHIVRCLTIKIRYGTPYPVTDSGKTIGLTEMVFQSFKKKGVSTLPVQLVKYKWHEVASWWWGGGWQSTENKKFESY
ncbi:MAG: hypothetical protein HY580_07735 [Nitrospinae bacterium]|nr:hypothetical protein [Nitrospinota bacterium]